MLERVQNMTSVDPWTCTKLDFHCVCVPLAGVEGASRSRGTWEPGSGWCLRRRPRQWQDSSPYRQRLTMSTKAGIQSNNSVRRHDRDEHMAESHAWAWERWEEEQTVWIGRFLAWGKRICTKTSVPGLVLHLLTYFLPCSSWAQDWRQHFAINDN